MRGAHRRGSPRPRRSRSESIRSPGPSSPTWNHPRSHEVVQTAATTAPDTPAGGAARLHPSQRSSTRCCATQAAAWADPEPWARPWRASPPWRCPSAIGRGAAVEAADPAAGRLPSVASALHRDARAPLNLTADRAPSTCIAATPTRASPCARYATRCSNATARDGRHDRRGPAPVAPHGRISQALAASCLRRGRSRQRGAPRGRGALRRRPVRCHHQRGRPEPLRPPYCRSTCCRRVSAPETCARRWQRSADSRSTTTARAA